MFGFWPIYKRELKESLQSVSTYVVLGLLFLIVGSIYHQILIVISEESIKTLAGQPFAVALDQLPNAVDRGRTLQRHV